MKRHHGIGSVVAWLGCGLLADVVAAQCAPGLASSAGTNGTDNFVYASELWDPDGPGPAPAVVALGGLFRLAGATFANAVVAYDPALQTFTALGGGITGGVAEVGDLLPLPNGDLIASGTFTTAGGVPAANIARWNGAA
nr:hypothetical protein [Planctomycetota bacterium]